MTENEEIYEYRYHMQIGIRLGMKKKFYTIAHYIALDHDITFRRWYQYLPFIETLYYAEPLICFN